MNCAYLLDISKQEPLSKFGLLVNTFINILYVVWIILLLTGVWH